MGNPLFSSKPKMAAQIHMTFLTAILYERSGISCIQNYMLIFVVEIEEPIFSVGEPSKTTLYNFSLFW